MVGEHLRIPDEGHAFGQQGHFAAGHGIRVGERCDDHEPQGVEHCDHGEHQKQHDDEVDGQITWRFLLTYMLVPGNYRSCFGATAPVVVADMMAAS